MARSEARIKVTIWDDPDFLALTIDAQWMYKMLCSQPGVSHAGVLTIPRREWTDLAADEDIADRIHAARKLLEDQRFIVVDDRKDELLIRAMIRTDVADGAPGTFRAAMDAAIAARSPKVRSALLGELLRLDEAAIEAKRAANRQELPIDAYRRALAALGPPGPRGHAALPTQMALDDSADTAPADESHATTDAMSDSNPHSMSDGMDSHAMPHAIGYRSGAGAGDGESSSRSVGSVSSGASRRRSPNKPLPETWTPTDKHRAFARERGVNLEHETQQFRTHAEANDRRAANWNAAFNNWLGKAYPRRQVAGGESHTEAWS